MSSPSRHSHAAAIAFLGLLAAIQLFFCVRREGVDGPWFLFGTDTVTHDAIVHLWVRQKMAAEPTRIPLWMPELQGGLPSIGAFLWTPFAPAALPCYLTGASYPFAQKAAWWLSLLIAGTGGWLLGRAMRLRWEAALLVGTGWMLAGHLVTLIHAGHFQKVMALSWLGWFAAGMTGFAQTGRWRRRIAHGSLAPLALGLAFLSGHPQIAYIMLCLGFGWILFEGLWRKRSRRRLPLNLAIWIFLMGMGLLLGAAQLIPGMEMSRLSNRASGVPWEEAVDTSYPPGELMELIVPRWKGTSVRGDVYTGEWGERIVSDYAGKLIVLLAALSLFAARGRRQFAVFWLLVFGMSILVGLGRYTPLYRLLYEALPGFQSFRSPGTFMAAAALALPVLAALGLEQLLRIVRSWLTQPRLPQAAAVGIILLAAGDLMVANRHFLLAESWNRFSAYLAPERPSDLWIERNGVELQVHDATNDLSLRPILLGRRAVNGYHPIVYQAKAEQDRQLGFNTLEWFSAWGLPYLIVPEAAETVPGIEQAAVFPAEGRAILELSEVPGFVTAQPEAHQVQVKLRGNGVLLEGEFPSKSRVVLRGIGAPGMAVFIDGTKREKISQVILNKELMLSKPRHSIELRYQPDSFRAGLFFSSVGISLIVFFMTLRAGHFAASRASPTTHSRSGGRR